MEDKSPEKIRRKTCLGSVLYGLTQGADRVFALQDFHSRGRGRKMGPFTIRVALEALETVGLAERVDGRWMPIDADHPDDRLLLAYKLYLDGMANSPRNAVDAWEREHSR